MFQQIIGSVTMENPWCHFQGFRGYFYRVVFLVSCSRLAYIVENHNTPFYGAFIELKKAAAAAFFFFDNHIEKTF